MCHLAVVFLCKKSGERVRLRHVIFMLLNSAWERPLGRQGASLAFWTWLSGPGPASGTDRRALGAVSLLARDGMIVLEGCVVIGDATCRVTEADPDS